MDHWIKLIEDRLLAIDGIESLYVTKEGRNVDIWAVIADHDSELLWLIAEADHAFMQEYVRSVPERETRLWFDFHVLSRGEQQEDEFVPQGSVKISRPAA